jgi:hypothetical protein
MRCLHGHLSGWRLFKPVSRPVGGNLHCEQEKGSGNFSPEPRRTILRRRFTPAHWVCWPPAHPPRHCSALRVSVFLRTPSSPLRKWRTGKNPFLLRGITVSVRCALRGRTSLSPASPKAERLPFPPWVRGHSVRVFPPTGLAHPPPPPQLLKELN